MHNFYVGAIGAIVAVKAVRILEALIYASKMEKLNKATGEAEE